jgi:hypothetical protein
MTRIGGLGLSKSDQGLAKVLGCEDPGGERVRRRLQVLREYRWSSWRVYGGTESRAREEVVKAAENLKGSPWEEWAERHGDWAGMRRCAWQCGMDECGWRLRDPLKLFI